MKFRITLFTIALFMVGCASTPTATPVAAPTAIPTEIPQPTQAPTSTALPPTPTRAAPTNTRPPPTNTPIPMTPTATVTNTRIPVTAQPTVAVTPTATEVVVRYAAPELIEPRAGDTRRLRKDAFVFRWNPVADLAANECYALRLRIVNLADPNKNYGEQTYLVESSCNSALGSGIVEFTVNGRAPAPNYDGLVDEADGRAGIDSQEYLVQWDVRVVLNQDGTLTPLSPASAISEFKLLNQ